MTQHVLFIGRYPMFVRRAVRRLDHGTPICAVKLYDIPPVGESNDARCPLL